MYVVSASGLFPDSGGASRRRSHSGTNTPQKNDDSEVRDPPPPSYLSRRAASCLSASLAVPLNMTDFCFPPTR